MGDAVVNDEFQGGQPPPRPRRRNLRTALVLATIALVFFVGVIVNRYLFGQ